jgi:hypothetical protein
MASRFSIEEDSSTRRTTTVRKNLCCRLLRCQRPSVKRRGKTKPLFRPGATTACLWPASAGSRCLLAAMGVFPARRRGPQQGVMRLCAVWTCRSGWVTVARQGFPPRGPRDGPARGGFPVAISGLTIAVYSPTGRPPARRTRPGTVAGGLQPDRWAIACAAPGGTMLVRGMGTAF